jgi:hypothetical protein
MISTRKPQQHRLYKKPLLAHLNTKPWQSTTMVGCLCLFVLPCACPSYILYSFLEYNVVHPMSKGMAAHCVSLSLLTDFTLAPLGSSIRVKPQCLVRAL